ncbi:zinc metalloprotease [Cryobacterium psychrophilum]|uniref:zinc metalloprotease n=1 Tax=Cryobacterium psychrophilum TaxID=41988 RepID=UPI0010EA7241|nr:zinc metalloprotease [Cryobacterium psychrophilum]TDW29987.1 pregnancy-associated plasma protein-A [Cryobacterium psychrophilum]
MANAVSRDLPTTRYCATPDVYTKQLAEQPGFAEARVALDVEALRTVARGIFAARAGVTRIPVVVHVVWHEDDQNISDEQIQSQIAVLNQDFRKTNADIIKLPEVFRSLADDAQVEFALATTDPGGEDTDGITRTHTDTRSFTYDDAIKFASSGGADAWPADKYLNLWVGRLSGGLLGYAQFPGGEPSTDGVVVLDTAVGTVGTASPPFGLGRTATHEIGHWLNLNHIWGDESGCVGTDKVDDTPNQADANVGKPAFPHVSCGNGPNGDLFADYMDYVDDDVMVMFSAGQIARIQACLDGPRNTFELVEDSVLAQRNRERLSGTDTM